MSSEMEAFAAAVAMANGRVREPAARRFGKATVLGGGADARLLATLCLANDADVTLFSAYGSELSALKSGITIRGDGPVGTYQTNQDGLPSIKTTAEIDAALDGADVVFLTGPIHKQRTYAMVLCDHLRDGQVIVVPNARSLGAIETQHLLRVGGLTADISIIEMQGLPFFVEEAGSTLNLSGAEAPIVASLPSVVRADLEALGALIGPVTPVANVLYSSFCDASAIVDFPVLTLGGPAIDLGGPRIVTGGVALSDNDTVRNLIGLHHMSIMAQLSDERNQVASAFGIRDLPDFDAILDRFAGRASGSGGRKIVSGDAAHKLLRDLAIGSLVPLLSAAEIAGCTAPMTQSALAQTSALLGADLEPAGRSLSSLGLAKATLDETRRSLELLAKGS